VEKEGTNERLKAHLGELINPKIREHRGRVVKNTGDGFLAEFSSVVAAVRCAVEVQRGMVEREPDVPEGGGSGSVSASISATLSWRSTTSLATV
jgi:adenylate cyclase